jgi:hypothetical protein
MNRADIEITSGGEGLPPEHQATLAIYKALICIHDTGPVAFWDAIPFETRPEVITIIDGVVEKLVALAVTERLAAIVRAAPGRRS